MFIDRPALPENITVIGVISDTHGLVRPEAIALVVTAMAGILGTYAGVQLRGHGRGQHEELPRDM